ncbi:MFS transporter [Comamonas antarctica]|uniref:MFS transporter n=1 Tax=Comamonas antarctica TaxID=2743470 RepID=UPI0028E80BBB|nr:MFS transporter [Comamonas antarctica]
MSCAIARPSLEASPSSPVSAAPHQGIARHTPEYLRAQWALFLAGFASFSLIYCVQPLLPAFAQTFGITAAQSSLALSLTTGLLAVAIVLAGAFSQALGRRGLMFTSMALASLLNIAAAVVPSWNALLAARALEGLVLGGVPAVAMAYLAEEIDPRHLARAMGLYLAGTAFGGMTGRVGMGLLTEWVSWQFALGLLGGLCLLSALGFLALLPPSRNFTPRPGLQLHFHLQAWGGHLRNRQLWSIYAVGFTLTSIFVSMFNYATFRLAGAPYGLSQTQISLLFLAFGFGMVASSTAGRLAERMGRRPLLLAGFALMLAGMLLTLSSALPVVFTGIALVTTGFFVGHAVASSSVGPLAGATKGHAASLYLLFYYLGSSVVGSIAGWFWQHGGWSAVVALTAALALLGLGLAWRGRGFAAAG